ncbi:TlpA disulfide reductase family protein [Streptobacillus moniliformis]|uniref:TlpA disulfide reductase family protein n=1 Tax=Streptobacillus moniliformis TaxID=34105 RepID=UPI0007E4B81E|nr:TlpA disulfide reductase family protein [Streptobacillus moniliformis]
MKKIILILMTFITFSCVLAENNNIKIVNNKNYENVIKKENNIIVYATSWCPHCQEELEELSKIQDELKDVKITVIMLPFIPTEDEFSNYEKETLEFINEKKYNFDFYLDKNKEILEKLNIQSIPSIGIIKDGNMIKEINEEEISSEKILEIFEK